MAIHSEHFVAGSDLVNPIKLLPNGHFLIKLSGSGADGKDSAMQEVDLAGKVVWQMTAAQLNAELATATVRVATSRSSEQTTISPSCPTVTSSYLLPRNRSSPAQP